MEDKPESGKLYSLTEISKGKTWKESVVKCAACGEEWPCTVYKSRKSYRPTISALHSPLEVVDEPKEPTS